MGEPQWQHFDHAADMGISASGATLPEVFTQVALGMMAIVTDQAVADSERVEIRCEAPDEEYLLVDWLNALIFEMATRRLVFGRFAVVIEPDGETPADGGYALRGQAWGETVSRARHHPAVELKGATYTALDVHKEADGHWIARCVVDV